MANCSSCGKKIGILETKHTIEDMGILCRYCYSNYTMKQERIRDEKRKEKIKREKKRKEEQIRMAVERKKAEESKWKEMDLGKLIENLGSSNVQSRVYAAKFIGGTKDRRAVTPLIEALKDGEEKVVMGAVEGLGKIGDPREQWMIYASCISVILKNFRKLNII